MDRKLHILFGVILLSSIILACYDDTKGYDLCFAKDDLVSLSSKNEILFRSSLKKNDVSVLHSVTKTRITAVARMNADQLQTKSLAFVQMIQKVAKIISLEIKYEIINEILLLKTVSLLN